VEKEVKFPCRDVDWDKGSLLLLTSTSNAWCTGGANLPRPITVGFLLPVLWLILNSWVSRVAK
jgi:hypothetical protein